MTRANQDRWHPSNRTAFVCCQARDKDPDMLLAIAQDPIHAALVAAFFAISGVTALVFFGFWLGARSVEDKVLNRIGGDETLFIRGKPLCVDTEHHYNQLHLCSVHMDMLKKGQSIPGVSTTEVTLDDSEVRRELERYKQKVAMIPWEAVREDVNKRLDECFEFHYRMAGPGIPARVSRDLISWEAVQAAFEVFSNIFGAHEKGTPWDHPSVRSSRNSATLDYAKALHKADQEDAENPSTPGETPGPTAMIIEPGKPNDDGGKVYFDVANRVYKNANGDILATKMDRFQNNRRWLQIRDRIANPPHEDGSYDDPPSQVVKIWEQRWEDDGGAIACDPDDGPGVMQTAHMDRVHVLFPHQWCKPGVSLHDMLVEAFDIDQRGYEEFTDRIPHLKDWWYLIEEGGLMRGPFDTELAAMHLAEQLDLASWHTSRRENGPIVMPSMPPGGPSP